VAVSGFLLCLVATVACAPRAGAARTDDEFAVGPADGEKANVDGALRTLVLRVRDGRARKIDQREANDGGGAGGLRVLLRVGH
jgi:hypothetical protein